jgi:thiamine kinase-like enzyme
VRAAVAAARDLGLAEWTGTVRPLHGDAHLGNVLNAPEGPLWGDWEDVFAGPLAWDLACLVTETRIYGTEAERVAEALRGYGGGVDDDELELFVEARALQAVAWSILITRRYPERRPRREARLRWFRERSGS